MGQKAFFYVTIDSGENRYGDMMYTADMSLTKIKYKFL